MSEREYLELGWMVRTGSVIGERTLTVYGCPDCGALVFYCGQHDEWHRRLEFTALP